jgi:DNA invertase Pin-like site-specific DNA recombinase
LKGLLGVIGMDFYPTSIPAAKFATKPIAEQERKRIGERTKAGMETARHKGKVLGRPRLRISRSEVLRLHAAGAGVAKIAAQLTSGRIRVSRETIRRLPRANDGVANQA